MAMSVLTVLIPVALWTVSNWCFTCLMNGEGKLTEVYTAICYSLTPMVLLYFPATILSRLMIQGEAPLLRAILVIALVWSCALIFVGMLVIHNYSLPKNVATSLLTVLGMLIILFLAVLFAGLMQRMVAFCLNMFNEIMFRL